MIPPDPIGTQMPAALPHVRWSVSHDVCGDIAIVVYVVPGRGKGTLLGRVPLAVEHVAS
jgi:hypothetical protein